MSEMGSRNPGSPRPVNADPILIVDRDAAFCRSLADGLAETGYAAVWTTDPERAAGLVAEQRFALLVIDETVPLETVRRDPGLPVLRLRGSADSAPAPKVRGVDVITLPVDRQALLARVWTLARSRRGLV
jgi:DNA-binding response OmpR family regulator